MFKKILLTITLFFIGLGLKLYGQLPDGTRSTREYIQMIIDNIDKEEEIDMDTVSLNFSADYSVIAYVVYDSSGDSWVDEADIIYGFSQLNTYFESIKVSFRVDTVIPVEDYNYSCISSVNDINELVVKHSHPNSINLYLVKSIEIDSVPSYGFTFFPNETGKNFIFLDKNYIAGMYLTTLMGHYAGLLSTHDTLGGAEWVNKQNCDTAGDFICDTYADPNLYQLVDMDCRYEAFLTDPTGMFYVPSVANIMSESRDGCKCIFTPMQLRRMVFYLMNYRNYLSYDQ